MRERFFSNWKTILIEVNALLWKTTPRLNQSVWKTLKLKKAVNQINLPTNFCALLNNPTSANVSHIMENLLIHTIHTYQIRSEKRFPIFVMEFVRLWKLRVWEFSTQLRCLGSNLVWKSISGISESNDQFYKKMEKVNFLWWPVFLMFSDMA